MSIKLIGAAMALSLFAAGAAHAATLNFAAKLDGASETPPTTSAGTGDMVGKLDTATKTFTYTVTFAGLTGPATMAHFHGPAKQGQNAPPVIWLSTQGSPPANPMTGTATLTPDQAKQFSAGEWYVNVHSQSHPAGEIRGQVIPPKS